MKPQKISAGRYEYKGLFIVRTDWEGPRGGTKYQWEIGHEDKYTGIVLDSTFIFRTMGEVVEYVDKHPEEVNVCTQCQETQAEVHGMCAPCLHDALRSGWEPPTPVADSPAVR